MKRTLGPYEISYEISQHRNDFLGKLEEFKLNRKKNQHSIIVPSIVYNYKNLNLNNWKNVWNVNNEYNLKVLSCSFSLTLQHQCIGVFDDTTNYKNLT